MYKSSNQLVLNKFMQLYKELLNHDGYGEIRVQMKSHRADSKEVTLHCGKQHRFVVDCNELATLGRDLLVVRRKVGRKQTQTQTPVSTERRVFDRRRGASHARSFKLERRVAINRRTTKRL